MIFDQFLLMLLLLLMLVLFVQIPSSSFPVRELVSRSELFSKLRSCTSMPADAEGRDGVDDGEEMVLVVFWQVKEG